MKPEKYNIERDEDDRCTACKSEDTDCECVGYNQACGDWKEHLPSEEEIEYILWKHEGILKMDATEGHKRNKEQLAKAIHKRIWGE